MYHWTITRRARIFVGCVWLVAITVAGTLCGLSWREALLTAAVTVTLILIIYDRYRQRLH